MPTNPIDTILPPVDDRVKPTLQYFSGLIDEAINFGTHVFQWHMQAAKGGDEIAPISLSIRHILEIFGAVSSCVRNSNIDPCKILLRAALESFLGLAYILQEDSVRRGYAFLAVEAHQRLKHYRALDPSTPESIQLARALSGDTVAPGFSHSLPQDVIQDAIQKVKAFLDTPGPKTAMAELRKLKRKHKNPNWYTLYEGPTNLEGLAARLRYQSLYQFLYRYWSRTTHGVDVIQGKLAHPSSGRSGVVQLRVPKEAQTVTQITITLGLKMFRLLVDKCCPEKSADAKVVRN
jgi:hypothetical protein